MTELAGNQSSDQCVIRTKLDLETIGVAKLHVFTADAYHVYIIQEITTIIENYPRRTFTISTRKNSVITYYTYDATCTKMILSTKRPNAVVIAAEKFLNRLT